MRREPGATYNSRALIDACKPFDWIDEFLPSLNPVLNTSTALVINGDMSFRTENWGSVDGRGRNPYAESMMATDCALGGSDEYCDPAGSV
jgi:hypothetical protein